MPNVLRISTTNSSTCHPPLHAAHHPSYEAYFPTWEQIRVVDTAAELMALVTYILPPRSILTIPYGGCYYSLLVIKHKAAIKSRTLGSKTAGWILPSGNVSSFLNLCLLASILEAPLLHFRWHLVHDSEANSAVQQSSFTVCNAMQRTCSRLWCHLWCSATYGGVPPVARALPPALLLISIRARFYFNTFHFQRSSFCPVQPW